MRRILKADICVVGGGSGGFAAALRSAQSGYRTILVEKEEILGGNSTVCGVNCWEPVTGASSGLPRELYNRMRQVPNGCGIYRNTRHFCLPDPAKNDFPGALQQIDPALGYDDTLKRDFVYGGSFQEIMTHWKGVIFEPRVLHYCIRQMLREAGCRIITGHACVEVEAADGHISSIRLDDGKQIIAEQWIDNCGILAASAKCRLCMGQDPASAYDEPDAPEEGGITQMNGVTLLFRVTPVVGKKRPLQFDGPERKCVMVATEYPNGDYNCNMLPTMHGNTFFALERHAALEEMQQRIREFWNYVQNNFQWGRDFRLSKVFTQPGIRESFRVKCRYMLNENDILAGVKKQEHNDLVVIADHQMDLHGAKNPGRIVRPYGVPYRCLLPENADNLLVTGRIAGFSSLAASSCRLSRTMIRLGEAAGFAAAAALQEKKDLRQISVKNLQQAIYFQDELSAVFR